MNIINTDLNLQTQIPLKKQSHDLIDYNSRLLLLGSCFSENIGEKFNHFKFQVLQNPFGILYHSNALENLILSAVNDKQYVESDVFFHNERWHCFDAHSDLSSTSKTQLLLNLNNAIKSTRQRIIDDSHVIITLGTAWVYRLIETDTVVANCHKVPQKNFLKEIQSVDSITESLQSIVALIRSLNYKASILFTISPVRHLKDGFIENKQSKSHLITAVHQVVDPRKNIHYFPSYEIMMDELRDYRFYNEDMLHPNPIAVHYIWERFNTVWISSEASQTMERVDNIQKGMQHKPFNPESEQHITFIKNLESQKRALIEDFPHISF